MSIMQKACLGAVLFKAELASILVADGNEALFSNHDLRIYREIRHLFRQGKSFNLVSLAEMLSNEVPSSYMADLMDYRLYCHPKNIEKDLREYLNTLRKNKIARSILLKIEGTIKNPRQHTDLINEIEQEISKVKLPDSKMESGNIEDFLRELDTKEDEDGQIFLGFPSLDIRIGGFRYGEVLLFMGRTTVGKTFWALNVLDHLVSQNKTNVALFSLEMPKLSILERLCQLHFAFDRDRALETLKSDNEKREDLTRQYRGLKIFTGNYSVEEIELKIREVNAKIVFIDYLDLIRESTLGNQTRYERISNLIIELKRIAKRRDVFLVVLQQLHRQAGDGSVPVRLTMARDSGVIEEASDFILGAWRPEIGYDDISLVPEDMKDRLFIKLLKNKRGPVEKVECFFNKGTGKIWEVRNEHNSGPI